MLDKLLDQQEETTNEVYLLRKDMLIFAREMQRDRMQLTEILRERSEKTREEQPPVVRNDNSRSTNEDDRDKSFKELLIGITALGVALYAFKDKLPDLITSGLTDLFRDLFGRGDDDGPGGPLELPEPGIVGETSTVLAMKTVAPKALTSSTNLVLRTAGNSFVDAVQEVGTRPTASRAATAAASLVTETVPESEIAKSIAKNVSSKSSALVAKGIPLAGSFVAAGFAAERLAAGDPVGAAIEAVGIFGTGGAVVSTATAITRQVYTDVYGITPEQDFKKDPSGTKERVLDLTNQIIPALQRQQESAEFDRKKGLRGKLDILESQPVGLLTPDQRSEMRSIQEELSKFPATMIPTPLSDTAATEIYGSETLVDLARGDYDYMTPFSTENSTRIDVSSAVDAGTTEAVESNSGGTNVTVVSPSTTNNNNTAITAGNSEGKRTVALNPVASNASTIDAYAMA